MAGYRNLILGMAYLVACGLMAFFAGADQVSSLGGTFGSLGLGVTGVVFGRAMNKHVENREIK